jgi:hypothetical protein
MMKTVDLLSPISSGFIGDKKPQEASPDQDSFEEALARRTHQAGREIVDQRNEKSEGCVGIMTGANDPSSSGKGGLSGSAGLEPEDRVRISEVTTRAASWRSTESSPQSFKSPSPRKTGMDSEDEENDIPRESAMPVPLPWELAEPDVTEIRPEEPTTPNTSGTAVPDSAKFGTDLTGDLSVLSKPQKGLAPGFDPPGSSPCQPKPTVLGVESGPPIVGKTMIGPEGSEGSPFRSAFVSADRMEMTGDTPATDEYGTLIEKSSDVPPDIKAKSLFSDAELKSPFQGQNRFLNDTSGSFNPPGNSFLSGEETNGFSFSSLPNHSGLSEMAEKILFEQKKVLKTTEGQESLGPDGIPTIQGSEKVLEVTPGLDRAEGRLSSESSRFNTTRIEEGEVLQHISNGMIRSFNQRGERIELALQPPELGNLFIEMKREKGNIKAILWTDNHQTKAILETGQAQLCKILKEDGLTLEKFDIMFDQDTRSFHEREKNPASHPPKGEQKPCDDGTSALADVLNTHGSSGREVHPEKNYLDLFV